MSTRSKIFIILGFILLFIFGLSIYVKSIFMNSFNTIKISDDSILEIPLVGDLVERSGDYNPMLQKFTGPSMNGIRKSFKMASGDARIKAVLLLPNVLNGAGFGKMQELGKIIKNFRKKSGKKVYAYIETCGNKEYYLASFCDSIFAVPTGMMLINGMQGNMYYVKDGLDKIGVSADFISVGKYKNAPEMFTRNSISTDQKEVMNRILDQYYNNYVETVIQNRGLSKKKVEQIIDIGLFSSKKAKEYGLIDQILYKNDIYEKLKAINGKIKKISYQNYTRQSLNKFYGSTKDKIAVVYAQGTINLGSGNIESSILSESFSKVIRKIKNNKKIKSVVLRIDSPGGSGTASEIIFNALKELKQSKPLIVSVSDVAASGGYYLAMAGDSIFAEPGSIVGSIGVFAGKFPVKGLYKKLGINKTTITRGENATFFSEDQPFSPSERQVLTEHIEDFYNIFVQKVADERDKSWEEIHDIAQGRVWTAEDGLNNGLIDKFGTLEDAILAAKKSAGFLEEEYVQIVTYPHIRPIFERFFEKFNIKADNNVLTVIENSSPKIKYFSHFINYKPYDMLTILPFYMELK